MTEDAKHKRKHTHSRRLETPPKRLRIYDLNKDPYDSDDAADIDITQPEDNVWQNGSNLEKEMLRYTCTAGQDVEVTSLDREFLAICLNMRDAFITRMWTSTPVSFLQNSGFIIHENKWFCIPSLYMDEIEIERWSTTFIHLCTLLATPPDARYALVKNSHPESTYAISQKLYSQIYKDHQQLCDTKINTFRADGVMCDAVVDDAHACVFLGRCRPRGDVLYAVVGGYFSSSPMLLKEARVSFPICAAFGFGKSVLFILWYGGECSVQQTDKFDSSFPVRDLGDDVSFEAESLDDVEEHYHKQKINELLKLLQEHTPRRSGYEDFEQRINEHVQDKEISVFSKLVKPGELTDYEKKIIDEYLENCALFTETHSVDREFSIIGKHIMIAILALLLGRFPAAIHLYLVDAEVIHSYFTDKELDVVSKSNRRKNVVRQMNKTQKHITIPAWASSLPTIFKTELKINTPRDLYQVTNTEILKVTNEDDDENPICLQKVKGKYNFKIDDISLGNEKQPIKAINTIDYDCVLGKEYLTDNKIGENVNLSNAKGYKPCKSCAVHNQVYYKGKLRKEYCNDNWELLIRECTSNCKCDAAPHKCPNRVSQRGISTDVKIYVQKTISKGWGVFAGSDIERGEFLGNYFGEIIRESEAEKRGLVYDNRGLSYLFDITPDRGSGSKFSESDLKRNHYSIDSTYYGNTTRLVNHSCKPNVICARVHSETKKFPNVAFFAMQKIKKGTELTIDYHIDINDMICHCGTKMCRYKNK